MKMAKKAVSALLALAVGAAAAVPVFAEAEEAQAASWVKVFDAAEYDYSGKTALITDITDIWTDWTVSGSGSAKYSYYAKVNGMSVRPGSSSEALNITSPGYAKNADAFKIEFTMGCGADYFDTMVYDTDGAPIFSYDYGAAGSGFYPQVADRSFSSKPAHLKSEPAEDASKNNGGEVYTTFTNDVSVMTITVENKNGAVDNTSHTEGNYYIVTYAHNGTVFDTEYYNGRANGFGSISCFKNGRGSDCVYAQMKIYEYSETNYVAKSGERYFETLDEAIDVIGKTWNAQKDYGTIELLADAEITRAHYSDSNSLRAYINGNNKKIKITNSQQSLDTISLKDVTLTGGVSGVGNNLTNYPGVDGEAIAWDNVKLENMLGDCLILNQGQIANCTITNYSGVCIFPNNNNGSKTSNGNLIRNTTITGTSVDSDFPAVRVFGDTNFVIDNSTITGTKTGENPTNDVTIVNGSLTVQGNTTIGLMNKTGNGSLTFKDFTGNVTLDSSFETEVGTAIAAVDGTFTGTVTLKDLDKNKELKVEDGKLVVAAKAPAEVKAVLSAAVWTTTDSSYSVGGDVNNKLTAPDGTIVFGYKAEFSNLSDDVTYTKVKATAKKNGGSEGDVKTQEKSMPTINTNGSVVFYILSTAELDLNSSSIVLE